MKIKLFTLPNILTLLNLACGVIAVVGMITRPTEESLRVAFVMILASAAFDFLDGLAARLTGQYSKLGVQLDSLADVVSFGLVPTLIALQIFYMVGGNGWWGALVIVMTAFSALRLAKFNIDESQITEFEGLPTPANALLVGSAGWCAALYMPAQVPLWAPWVVLGCTLALACLLISRVRMFSLKFAGSGLRENAVKYVFIASAALLVILFRGAGVGMAVVLYILESLIMWLACPSRRGKRI